MDRIAQRDAHYDGPRTYGDRRNRMARQRHERQREQRAARHGNQGQQEMCIRDRLASSRHRQRPEREDQRLQQLASRHEQPECVEGGGLDDHESVGLYGLGFP